ncbi:MAG: TIGR03618 family F420-dependent PPOX class oxidoreductase [Dehalococcoidia bacterium]
MTVEQRDAFLAVPRIATLVTLNADDSPTAVPVWFEWDGERARVFTGRGSPKLRRIARDARVCLTVAEPVGVPEAWVTIEGTARVEEGGMAVAERLAPRYYTPEKAAAVLPSWRQMAEQWVVIVIEPARIRSGAPE